MYNRVLDSINTEFSDIPAGSDGAEALAGLREQYEIIVDKSSAKSGFSGDAQESTAQKAVARQNIKDYLTTLANSAQSIARKKAGFDRNFPMPYGKNDVELLNEARAVAVKAQEAREDFTKRGLTVDFINSINTFINDFETSQDSVNQAIGARGSTVGSKNEAYEKAEDYFDTLNDFIRNFYRDRPEKLAAWKIVSHIRRATDKKDGNNG